MSEEFEQSETVEIKPPQGAEQQVGLSDGFIREILELLSHDYVDRIQELCRDLPATDAADLLLKAGKEPRHRLVDLLEDSMPPDTFSYLDHDTLNDLFDHMSGAHIASIVNELDSDDAISLIGDLAEDRRADIMRHLSRKVRSAVEESLTYPEDSAGRMMQREFVAIPQFWTIGKTVDYMRAAAEALPEKFYDIFIVDPMHRFVGAVSLSRVLCAQRAVKIDALVEEDHVTIPVTMPQDDVAHLFRRKDLMSAPVIDPDGQLIGVITVDDIVDVIDEEAERDFLSLGGVTDTDIHRPIMPTAKARFIWLAVNLVTAIAASIVIGMFEESIAKIAILAVLMPIVASMGGNAGTQTLAIAVRGLATKELSDANAGRVIGKEVVVGIINGVLFAILTGIAVWLWFQNPQLGLVIGAAMILNLVAAGFSGAIIPIALNKLGIDPAQSAVVFLTTVTDIVGFFAFLGLATWFLL